MAAFTENDLKRLEDLIIASRDENRARFTALENQIIGLETGVAALQKDVNGIKASVGKVEESLKGLDKRLSLVETSIQKIPDLAEKVGELKNWRQIVIRLSRYSGVKCLLCYILGASVAPLRPRSNPWL